MIHSLKKCPARWLSLGLLCSGFLLACGSGGGSSESPQLGGAQARVLLRGAFPLAMDSITIQVSGSAMDTLRWKWENPQGSVLDLRNLVPGSDRHFEVLLWEGGEPVQEGEAVASLAQGEHLSLAVELRALRGYLRLEIPVGMDAGQGVSGGFISICNQADCDTLSLVGSGPLRRFQSGALPLETLLEVDLRLWNAGGDTLYAAAQQLRLSASDPWIQLPLTSLFTSVALALEVGEEPVVRASALYPGARSRQPQRSGDLIFTELHPNPKVSGNDFEWVELLNTTTDTLLLDSCRLAKDRATTGSTSMALLTAVPPVLPGSFAVFGRDSVDFAAARYGGFTLSNTSQAVILACGALLVDSVHYYAPTDTINPFPISAGATIEVPVDSAFRRDWGGAWCAGSEPFEYAIGGGGLGSPGRDADCR